MMNAQNEPKEDLEQEEARKKYDEMLEEALLSILIQLGVQGYSCEEIISMRNKERMKNKEKKMSKDEEKELEILYERVQPHICLAKSNIAMEKPYVDCLSSMGDALEIYEQILSQVDKEILTRSFSNLTTHELLKLKITCLEAKDKNVVNLLKYKYKK
ncbi:MAG: hypothetical protein ACI9UO_002143 [Nitrospinales bacterium]|jgi:hypothetical protein